jgi:hypothetical protein
MKGSQFVQSIMNLPLNQQQEPIYQAAVNQSAWIRWPMTLVVVHGKGHEVGFVVSDDYFAIGEDDDYVRVPMNPITAQRIADKLGFMLPTARMVDLIWTGAPIKVEPRPMQQELNPNGVPTGQIFVGQGQKAGQSSTAGFAAHSMLVDGQFAALGMQPGIRAGHKKDVVLTNRLQGSATVTEVSGPAKSVDASNQVAIYGWHRGKPAGDCSKFPTISGLCPIQGLSIVHDNKYADYSHGIRMVSPLAMLDGQSVNLVDILTNPELAPLLSHEGVLQVLRQPHVPPPIGGESFLPPTKTLLAGPNKAVLSTGGPAALEPPPVVTAGLSGGGKAALIIAGAVVGYYGLEWLLKQRSA